MLDIRFGLATDLHIALPHTIPATTDRFHRTEISIAAFEAALSAFDQLDLDFLLLSGDLTQDGEIDNHAWLAQRLGQISYPVYVVPGNHDILTTQGSTTTIGVAEFGRYYSKFGYANTDQLYYTQQIAPHVRLIGLNSIFFDGDKQTYRGRVDARQMAWLEDVLTASKDELVLVMVHHNVIEHLPGQAESRMGQRYMLQNAPELLALLARHGVQLIFTGHLHVQDVARAPYPQPIYDIATGSTVSYPHPFRVMHYRETSPGAGNLQIESRHVRQIPEREDLQTWSREYVGDRSFHFVKRMLTAEPLALSEEAADQLLPELRYLWADIARGDAHFDFPQFESKVRRYFERFSCGEAIDNAAVLSVQRPVSATLAAPH